MDSIKVFVGKRLGQKKVYVLGPKKLEVLTHDYISPDVIDYLEVHLPKLAEEDKIILEGLKIEPI